MNEDALEAIRERFSLPTGGALDYARRASSGVKQQRSNASSEAANRLLEKAMEVWESDREKAIGYLRVAAKLPFDPHEEVLPLLWEAEMLLFDCVVDEVEAADQQETLWLDAALEALDRADERGRFALRDTLVTVASDYRLLAREERRIQQAVAGIPNRVRLSDLTDASPEEAAEHAASVVELVTRYTAAMDTAV